MNIMLRLRNIEKAFPGGVHALRSVNLDAAEGEIISIVGPSGCGKSTLLRIVGGLDREFEGDVELESNHSHQGVGIIFQEPRLMPWLSARDNVAFGLRRPRADRRAIAHDLLNRVGLRGSEDVLPKALSGGMAQRVAIARALATEPEVLLLDEPFSALDAFTKMKLQDLLLEIWSDIGTTMLLVTHDVEEAVYLSDRVVVMSGCPGTIHSIFRVHSPRPRVRTDEHLARLRGDVLTALGMTPAHAEAA
jgi:sulfonate transport system ATP-binding protein